jgi:hypothetical protein
MLLDIQNLIKTVYYSPHISIFARDQGRNLLFLKSQKTCSLSIKMLSFETYTSWRMTPVLCDCIKMHSN